MSSTNPKHPLRNAKRAVELAMIAAASGEFKTLGALAAAYAGAGRFSEVIATAEEALELARGRLPASAEQLVFRLASCRRSRPFRMSS